MFFYIQILPIFILTLFYAFNYHSLKEQFYKIIGCKIFYIGVIGFFLSMIPFILGGRSVYFEGWNLRFLAYSAYPMSFIYVSLISNLIVNKKAIKIFLYLFFTLYQVFFFYNHSVDWHIRWVRDNTLVEYIKSNIKNNVGLVILIDKEKPMFNEEVRWYENTGFVQKALQRNNVIGSGETTV